MKMAKRANDVLLFLRHCFHQNVALDIHKPDMVSSSGLPFCLDCLSLYHFDDNSIIVLPFWQQKKKIYLQILFFMI